MTPLRVIPGGRTKNADRSRRATVRKLLVNPHAVTRDEAAQFTAGISADFKAWCARQKVSAVPTRCRRIGADA